MTYFNFRSDISGIQVETRVSSLVTEDNQSVNERVRFGVNLLTILLKDPFLDMG